LLELVELCRKLLFGAVIPLLMGAVFEIGMGIALVFVRDELKG